MLMMDVEFLLEHYLTDKIVLTFGNRNNSEPYMELIIDKNLAKDGRIQYVTSECTPTGKINHNLVAPFFGGATLNDIREHFLVLLKDQKEHDEKSEVNE